MPMTRYHERSNIMKKQYISPIYEVLYLKTCDIMAFSGETDDIAVDIFEPLKTAGV